jgi:hypothetical protein
MSSIHLILDAVLLAFMLTVVAGQRTLLDEQWAGGDGYSCYQRGASLIKPEIEGTAKLEDCKSVCVSNSHCVAVYHDKQSRRCFMYFTKPMEADDGCINGRGCDKPTGNCHVLLEREPTPTSKPTSSLRGNQPSVDSNSDSQTSNQDNHKGSLDFTTEAKVIELCKDVQCTEDEFCDVNWHHETDEQPEAVCRRIKEVYSEAPRREPQEEKQDLMEASPALWLLIPLSAVVLCAIVGWIRAQRYNKEKLNSETARVPSKTGQTASSTQHSVTELQKELPTVLSTASVTQLQKELKEVVDHPSEKSNAPKDGLLPQWVIDAPGAQRGRQQARTSAHSRKERSTSPANSNASTQSKRSLRSTTSSGSVSIRALKAIEGHPDASDVSTHATGDSLRDKHLPAARALAEQWDAEITTKAARRGRSEQKAPRDAQHRDESPGTSVASTQSRQSRRSNRM